MPLLSAVLPISRRQLPAEVLAGLTLAALGIPEVLGYAEHRPDAGRHRALHDAAADGGIRDPRLVPPPCGRRRFGDGGDPRGRRGRCRRPGQPSVSATGGLDRADGRGAPADREAGAAGLSGQFPFAHRAHRIPDGSGDFRRDRPASAAARDPGDGDRDPGQARLHARPPRRHIDDHPCRCCGGHRHRRGDAARCPPDTRSAHRRRGRHRAEPGAAFRSARHSRARSCPERTAVLRRTRIRNPRHRRALRHGHRHFARHSRAKFGHCPGVRRAVRRTPRRRSGPARAVRRQCHRRFQRDRSW